MILDREHLLMRMDGNEKDWNCRLVIEPLFDQSESASAPSFDFHLGNRFSVPKRRRAVQHDPMREDAEEDVTGAELSVALGEKFVLHPGQIVLGMTLEWFRFPNDLAASIVGRSIWGRRGLLVAPAMAVQPGSSGNVTLELSNVGEIAIVLRPGAAIGQMFFHEISKDTASDHASWGRSSPYTASNRPILGEYRRTTVERFLLSGGGSSTEQMEQEIDCL